MSNCWHWGCVFGENCCRFVLRDVRHVPEVRLNLISVGRLDDEGYTGSIRNGVMKFCKGSLIVAGARKTNTLYLMHARLCRGEANVAADTVGELWHRRLCHMSQKGMRKLADDNLAPEVKNVQLEKCTDCLSGKQNRTSFRARPPMRKKMLMELVHMDICYVDAKSQRGSQYFMTFIEDYSQKLSASVLKRKNEVLSVFKEFQARAERETGRKLKAVRIDNGGEYRRPFEEYC